MLPQRNRAKAAGHRGPRTALFQDTYAPKQAPRQSTRTPRSVPHQLQPLSPGLLQKRGRNDVAKPTPRPDSEGATPRGGARKQRSGQPRDHGETADVMGAPHPQERPPPPLLPGANAPYNRRGDPLTGLKARQGVAAPVAAPRRRRTHPASADAIAFRYFTEQRQTSSAALTPSLSRAGASNEARPSLRRQSDVVGSKHVASGDVRDPDFHPDRCVRYPSRPASSLVPTEAVPAFSCFREASVETGDATKSDLEEHTSGGVSSSYGAAPPSVSTTWDTLSEGSIDQGLGKAMAGGTGDQADFYLTSVGADAAFEEPGAELDHGEAKAVSPKHPRQHRAIYAGVMPAPANYGRRHVDSAASLDEEWVRTNVIEALESLWSDLVKTHEATAMLDAAGESERTATPPKLSTTSAPGAKRSKRRKATERAATQESAKELERADPLEEADLPQQAPRPTVRKGRYPSLTRSSTSSATGDMGGDEDEDDDDSWLRREPPETSKRSPLRTDAASRESVPSRPRRESLGLSADCLAAAADAAPVEMSPDRPSPTDELAEVTDFGRRVHGRARATSRAVPWLTEPLIMTAEDGTQVTLSPGAAAARAAFMEAHPGVPYRLPVNVQDALRQHSSRSSTAREEEVRLRLNTSVSASSAEEGSSDTASSSDLSDMGLDVVRFSESTARQSTRIGSLRRTSDSVHRRNGSSARGSRTAANGLPSRSGLLDDSVLRSTILSSAALPATQPRQRRTEDGDSHSPVRPTVAQAAVPSLGRLSQHAPDPLPSDSPGTDSGSGARTPSISPPDGPLPVVIPAVEHHSGHVDSLIFDDEADLAGVELGRETSSEGFRSPSSNSGANRTDESRTAAASAQGGENLSDILMDRRPFLSAAPLDMGASGTDADMSEASDEAP